MLNVMKGFSMNQKNGLFVNSCFAHCQSERQDTWFADDSPLIGNKVGNIDNHVFILYLRNYLHTRVFFHLQN